MKERENIERTKKREKQRSKWTNRTQNERGKGANGQ